MRDLAVTQLRAVMPRLRAGLARDYLRYMTPAMVAFEITTTDRLAHFLSQVAHESAELTIWRELWGPMEWQLRYEGRADLGNLQPGDGYRFRGAGPLQLTGRRNHEHHGHRLSLPLVDYPCLAATPDYGFLVSCDYWADRGINALADRGRHGIEQVTRAINGGLNGLRERTRYLERAYDALS